MRDPLIPNDVGACPRMLHLCRDRIAQPVCPSLSNDVQQIVDVRFYDCMCTFFADEGHGYASIVGVSEV
jgi:hypothetical protein